MKRMRDGSYTIKPTYKVGEHDIVPDMLAKRALLHPRPGGGRAPFFRRLHAFSHHI